MRQSWKRSFNFGARVKSLGKKGMRKEPFSKGFSPIAKGEKTTLGFFVFVENRAQTAARDALTVPLLSQCFDMINAKDGSAAPALAPE